VEHSQVTGDRQVHTQGAPCTQDLITASDQVFLIGSMDLSEDKLAGMLENLKKTLDSYKCNTRTVTKGFTDSMLVKRR